MTKNISEGRDDLLNRISISDLMGRHRILYITTAEYMSNVCMQTLVEKCKVETRRLAVKRC